jgi:hypothetical protein
MRRADFAGAILAKADLTGADLTGANLTGARGLAREKLSVAFAYDSDALIVTGRVAVNPRVPQESIPDEPALPIPNDEKEMPSK